MAASARQLVRDAAALFSGELLGKIAGFVAFAALARRLAPDTYGAVELAVGLSMFFMLIVDFGFGPVGAREIARDASRAVPLAAEIPAIRLLLAVIATSGMSATVWLLPGLGHDARVLGTLFAIALLGTAWASRWLFQGLDRMIAAALPQALRMLLFAVGVVLLVHADGELWRVGAIEIASVAAMAIYYLVAQLRIVGPVRLDFRPTALRPLLVEALPMGTSQLVWAMNQYLPIVLIATLIGGAEVAWFGSAHRIVMSLSTFVWLYYFNLFPSLVRAGEAGGDALGQLLGRSFRVSTWSGLGGGLVASVSAKELCRAVYGPGFEAAAVPFALLAWSIPVALASGHARFSLIAAGRQVEDLRANAAGAVFTAAACVALIPRYAAAGAAAALLGSTVVIWLVAHARAARFLGPIPFLGPVARPAAAAIAAAALHRLLADSPVAAAAGAIGLYLALALVLEPALLRDLRELRREERGAPAPTAASGAKP
ncbi:MAG TPA: oligosaccharide flippase family protein [Myxococcota bacterium]|nr:oligosaccharide flippase family protein [Myxococcota bacterium]